MSILTNFPSKQDPHAWGGARQPSFQSLFGTISMTVVTPHFILIPCITLLLAPIPCITLLLAPIPWLHHHSQYLTIFGHFQHFTIFGIICTIIIHRWLKSWVTPISDEICRVRTSHQKIIWIWIIIIAFCCWILCFHLLSFKYSTKRRTPLSDKSQTPEQFPVALMRLK